MLHFNQTSEFSDWLLRLKDHLGKAAILNRLTSAQMGNFGDSEPVGHGVSEMRIHHGPGYRVYYTRTGSTIYLLLIGGSKSTQKRDIKRAIDMLTLL